jgi:putative hemolysin
MPERVEFTYSHDGQPWLRRQMICAIERVSGSGHFRDLYEDWVASGSDGNPFDAALAGLNIRIGLSGTPVADISKTGGVLLVANHPFGIADGLSLGWLASQLRQDVRILTHSLLCAAPEFRPYLLPVDFAETPEARRRSATARRRAVEVLENGGAVAIFPGGSVATSNRPFHRPAAELPWHSFVARLATTEGISVVPVHFQGQNSHLFQLASHVSYPLRIALLFHETRRRIGGEIAMTVGDPLPSSDIAVMPRAEIAPALRKACLDLGGADASEAFQWPRHIRW